MVKIIEGQSNTKGKRVAIVVSKFNEFITNSLLKACLEELERTGRNERNITVAWVPGSFEIPVVAQKFAKRKDIHAVICLGCIIRGETAHYDLVAEGTVQGIMQAAMNSGKPVVFGVLAVDTVDQAYKRSEKKGDNKGRDAAITALEMIDVLKRISGSRK